MLRQTEYLMMTDTIIEKRYLVDLEDEGDVVAQLLWGIVVEDRKSRWVAGDFVCTSPVVEQMGERLYRTRNSKYLGQAEGHKVALKAEALLELCSGYSPEEYLARKALRNEAFYVQ
tara:strand:- start:32 stop:379 length:348 start_codon:yes stop_codon:yes gene_type:complete